MSSDFYLSIVIPAFREEKRISQVLDAIVEFEKDCDFSIETIVVDDASPDSTVKVVKKYENIIKNLVIIEEKVNKGKGGAVSVGVMKARGKYIVFADADNATPIEQVKKLLNYIGDYEVVIGSRYCEGGKLAVPQSVVRIIGGRLLNRLIQYAVAPGIKDTQCGFKLFEAKAAKNIFSNLTIYGWSFDIEVIGIAKALGYKVKEVGVTWYDSPHSTLHPFKDGLKMIKDAWQIKKNIRESVYKKTFHD